MSIMEIKTKQHSSHAIKYTYNISSFTKGLKASGEIDDITLVDRYLHKAKRSSDIKIK